MRRGNGLQVASCLDSDLQKAVSLLAPKLVLSRRLSRASGEASDTREPILGGLATLCERAWSSLIRYSARGVG